MRRGLAAAALAAAILAGCSGHQAASTRPSSFATLGDFYSQQAEWHGCTVATGRMQCASVRVPTDYANPAAGTTTIRLGRVASSGHSRGPLLMNPGGPGGSGIEFVGLFANAVPRLRAAYDLVGFDPRGVGASDPVRCLDTRQLDELTAANVPPPTPAQATQRSELIRREGDACRRHAGALASHMTTVETARDLDIIRAAVGSPRLDYYGASYGTFLGATYAALFPNRIGRMVLDGAVDPQLSHDQLALGQAQGFQQELDAMIDHCLALPACLLGDTRAQAVRAITRMLARAAGNPLPTGDDRPLTQGLAVHGLAEGLYRTDDWPQLEVAIRAAEDGSGALLRRFSDEYYRRREGRYASNETEAYTAIDCLDAQANPKPEADPAVAVRTHITRLRRVPQGGQRDLRRLAADNRAARPGLPPVRDAADRRPLNDRRSGDAVRVGRPPRAGAGIRRAGHPRRRGPHGLRVGQSVHRRGRQRVPGRRHDAAGRAEVLRGPGRDGPAPSDSYSSSTGGTNGSSAPGLGVRSSSSSSATATAAPYCSSAASGARIAGGSSVGEIATER